MRDKRSAKGRKPDPKQDKARRFLLSPEGRKALRELERACKPLWEAKEAEARQRLNLPIKAYRAARLEDPGAVADLPPSPPPSGKQEFTKHPSEDLPLDGWRGLFSIALSRLKKTKPAWADLTQNDAERLEMCWLTSQGEPLAVRLEWLLAVLENRGRRDLSRGKLKPRPDPPTARLLVVYEDLCAHLRGIKTTLREAKKRGEKPSKGFWRDHLEALLTILSERGRKTPVNPDLAENLAENLSRLSPSEGAREILKYVYSRSPEYLKREFVRLRKPFTKTPIK